MRRCLQMSSWTYRECSSPARSPALHTRDDQVQNAPDKNARDTVSFSRQLNSTKNRRSENYTFSGVRAGHSLGAPTMPYFGFRNNNCTSNFAATTSVVCETREIVQNNDWITI